MSEPKRKAIVFDLKPPGAKTTGSAAASYTPACLQPPPRRQRVQTQEQASAAPGERPAAHLQPELLTGEYLARALREAGHPLERLSAAPREQLIQLFLDTVTSKPQRRYPDTRLGRKLSKSQERCPVKEQSSCQLFEKGGKAKTEAASGGSSNLSSGCEERLKPPPFKGSYIDTSRKTIRLGGAASTPKKEGDSSSKLSSVNIISPPKAGEKRKISFSSTDDGPKSPPKKVVLNKNKLEIDGKRKISFSSSREDGGKSSTNKVVLNKDKLEIDGKRKISISPSDSLKKLKVEDKLKEDGSPAKKRAPVGWP